MTPAKDIVSAIKAIGANAAADPERVRAGELRRWHDQRLARIRPYASVVPPEAKRRIVEGTLDSHAWSMVKRFLERWRRGRMAFLWLCGGLGRGKTCAALGAIAAEGGRLMSAEDLRRGYRQETKEAQALRRFAEDTRLLVIDDSGTERRGDEASLALQQVVNKRQGGQATIITTNLEEKQILAQYDARIIDRVIQQGGIYEVKGENLRHAKKVRALRPATGRPALPAAGGDQPRRKA